MKIIKINIKNPEVEKIDKARRVLEKGGVIIYPTDTAYGIGVNALNKDAVRKVYELKGRNFSKPIHVVVRDWWIIKKLCFVNADAKKLYDKFLPGPLTIILPKKKVVPDILTANYKTLGVRIPNCKVTQMISKLVDFPYTTTSANYSGGDTPYSVADVTKQLDICKIYLLLDAGKLPKVKPSTIVDLSSDSLKILRNGPVSTSKIKKSLL